MPPSREQGDTDRALEEAAVAALRRAGAVSPETAVRLREAGVEPSEALGVLIVRGVVREARPGTYYVFAGGEPLVPPPERPAPTGTVWTPARKRRWLLVLLVWLVLLLLPVLFLQVAGSR